MLGVAVANRSQGFVLSGNFFDVLTHLLPMLPFVTLYTSYMVIAHPPSAKYPLDTGTGESIHDHAWTAHLSLPFPSMT